MRRPARYLRRKLEALLTRSLSQDVAALRAEAAALRQAADQTLLAIDRLRSGQDQIAEGQAQLLRRVLREIGQAGGGQARGGAAAADPGQAWQDALRGIGVLNYENSVVSGERNFIVQFFRHFPDAVVLDVGANEGQFADLARAHGPEATIHCFEPQPKAFATLADRAGRLGVTVHQLALSDADGEAEFFDYADEQGSQHASLYREVIESVHGRPAAAVKVRCARLDSLLPGLGIGHVGLLKIDTEGHELAVLKGAQALLAAGAVDVIQFEFNEMNVISRVFMKDFLDLLPGYRFFRLMPRGAIELAPYDPRSMEIFAFQNIACIREGLSTHWVTAEAPA